MNGSFLVPLALAVAGACISSSAVAQNRYIDELETESIQSYCERASPDNVNGCVVRMRNRLARQSEPRDMSGGEIALGLLGPLAVLWLFLRRA
jgi:hypothetical protein